MRIWITLLGAAIFLANFWCFNRANQQTAPSSRAGLAWSASGAVLFVSGIVTIMYGIGM
jgi:hypothetical protein